VLGSPTAKMGPLAGQVTLTGGAVSQPARHKLQCSAWSAHWAPSFNNRCSAAMATPSSSEAAGETWSDACSRTRLVALPPLLGLLRHFTLLRGFPSLATLLLL
jgi:hypothetical protein